MRKNLFFLTLVVLAVASFVACNKWKDPAPVNDPRLTNPYCNDPGAVNYNWGFPGKPDNSICFYPTDLFKGTYLFIDSVYQSSTGYFLYEDSITLNFYPIDGSHTRLAVIGFCGTDSLLLTAGVGSFTASVDTTLGDSLTYRGQRWCRILDTVNGTILNSRIDTLLHVNLQIISDTGITTHVGKARKI